ncbi:MAG: HoxN/HupN/NixA family nickel/cobalt transporter [Dermatophilaceae bacterium]
MSMRHAFDADHIAAIDDTTRVMLMRGRRPIGVGFFFAMGHSTVVVVLALLVAAAGRITQTQVDSMRSAGGTIAVGVAMVFLLVLAVLSLAFLSGYASLSESFEFFGYGIAAIFATTWVGALVFWKRCGRIAAVA